MKKALISALVPLFMIACGGGGSDVSSVDKLPKMTSPVISGTSASSVKVDNALTGLTYWGASSSSFTHGQSRSMCESFNITREIMNKAAQSDRILCYIQNTIVAPVNSGRVGTADDGNYHMVTLDFGGTVPNPSSHNTAPVMKFKIKKDGDKITEFEMFNCMAGTASAPVQSEYQHQVINGSDITITSKDIEGQYNNSISATGKLDGTRFTQKQITGISYSTESCTNAAKTVIDQFADAIVASAYQIGTCGSNTYSTQAYAKFQLLNGNNADIHQWAVGDGTVKVKTSNNGSLTNPENTISWNGDSKVDIAAASGMYYSPVSAGTIPATDPTAEAIALDFAASEKWDCSGTPEATMVVDMAALTPICDQYGLEPDGGNTWIDCYNATGN